MTSFQVAQWLRQGIAAAKAGDIDRAYDLLVKVVDVDEFNEQAWLWLSSVVKSDADRQVCLENVLAINPENKLAKAGLVHLRAKKAPPPPPSDVEPELPLQPRRAPAVPQEMPEGPETDWWDRPFAPEAAAVSTDTWPPAPSRTAAAPAVEAEQTRPEAGRTWHRPRISFERAAISLLLILGLALAAGAVGVFMRSDLLDPAKREYATAMQPVLQEYDAWWQGDQGQLVTNVNSLCGDEADGWRNWDVMLVCSTHSSQDCSLLAAHCGEDVDAMRDRIDDLSQEAQTSGQRLLTAFNAISPPLEIATAHGQLMACLQEHVQNAGRIGRLAKGTPLSNPDTPPICQLFPSAEADVRAYVGAP